MKGMQSAAFFILFAAGVISAQQPVISSDTTVDQVTLRQWLHGSDPRLIAWAADFARRDHDAALLAEMPGLLQHWTMPPAYDGDEAQAAQRRAILAVLDALIQENAVVPVPVIDVIAPSFPDQAAILIAKQPLSASRNTLDHWTYETTGGWGGRMLARIASMMLAKDPGKGSDFALDGLPASFVASVVAASEVDVIVHVRGKHPAGSGFGTATCGDSIGSAVIPGWPDVYAYSLDEANNRAPRGSVVVEIDGDVIFSQRRKESDGWGECGGGVEALDPVTRHRLLAHWLGTSDAAMTWQPVDAFTIVWNDTKAYEEQLGNIVESERRKLQATVELLRQRGFLREDEAAMPRLIVTVRCDIKPCPLK